MPLIRPAGGCIKGILFKFSAPNYLARVKSYLSKSFFLYGTVNGAKEYVVTEVFAKAPKKNGESIRGDCGFPKNH